jgi:hypothetical protein
MKLFYMRTSDSTMFLLPSLAVGMDGGMPFIEFAWLFWAVGVGDAG